MPQDIFPIVKKPKLIKYGGIDPGVRRGRGFSIGELRAVGLDIPSARKLGIPVDKRRRSVHQWNIERLKSLIQEIREKRGKQ